MKSTIKYYNTNADRYYLETVDVEFAALRDRFASYLPEHASIVDIGCGSGRDVRAFCEMGFQAIGVDASEELAKLARGRLGIEVVVADMATWRAETPFDGIWCNASLLHLSEKEVTSFFSNLKANLKPGGVLFISVKSGIVSGLDEYGRYMKNYTQGELTQYFTDAGCEVTETYVTEDKFGRVGFSWLNVFAIMKTA